MPNITELKIDRALWGRGALLNPSGTMCCLGHASVACGVPKSELTLKPSLSKCDDTILGYPRASWIGKYGLNPAFAERYVDERLKVMPPGSDVFSDRAARINDSLDITDNDKETKLIKLFSIVGVTLSFYGSKCDEVEDVTTDE
jgi:hypothetical protein